MKMFQHLGSYRANRLAGVSAILNLTPGKKGLRSTEDIKALKIVVKGSMTVTSPFSSKGKT